MDKLVERLVEMDAKFPAEGSEVRLAVIPAKALPALAEYVKAAQELRDCPAHPLLVEIHRERCRAYDAARAALLAALGGDAALTPQPEVGR